MNEFKTVVENFRSDMKKMSEAIGALQSKVDGEFQYMHDQFSYMHDQFSYMHDQFGSAKEQIAILLEGQTEIKNNLKGNVDREEFGRLEMRVTKLENKVA